MAAMLWLSGRQSYSPEKRRKKNWIDSAFPRGRAESAFNIYHDILFSNPSLGYHVGNWEKNEKIGAGGPNPPHIMSVRGFCGSAVLVGDDAEGGCVSQQDKAN